LTWAQLIGSNFGQTRDSVPFFRARFRRMENSKLWDSVPFIFLFPPSAGEKLSLSRQVGAHLAALHLERQREDWPVSRHPARVCGNFVHCEKFHN